MDLLFGFQQKAIESLTFNSTTFKDKDLKRKFKKLSDVGYALLPAQKFKEITAAVTAMSTNYAKVRVCSFKDKNNCTLQLDPGLFDF